jgi:hypothetical protein
MDKTDLYIALTGFSNLSMDEQGEVTEKLYQVLDRLASGVWNRIEGGMRGFSFEQCTFCCVSPEYPQEHADWCLVRLARELKEKFELEKVER